MRGGWIVVIGLVGGCTAPNPAFGDGDRGTGSTSNDGETTDKPTTDPTLDPTRDTTPETTGDPSRADSTSDDDTTVPVDTGSMSSGSTQPMTSDDDTSTPTTSTDGGSSEVTGDPAAEVLLYVAAIDDGALSADGGATVVQVGATICADTLEQLGLDPCNGTSHALIRVGLQPFSAPILVESLDRGVYSVEGEAIAETLQDFFDGDWLVPQLTSIAGGGFDELAFSPLATGGSSNNDLNCEGWSTTEGDFTIGDVDSGGGWFSAGEAACSSPARMLCLCLP